MIILSINNEIIELVNSYMDWFKKGISVHELKDGEHSVIHTPFLDFNNDKISIYASICNGKICLSDDGQTLNNLDMYGLSFTKKRNDLVNHILSQHKVIIVENKELLKQVTKASFSEGLHSMITAMIDIGNLYLTSQEKVLSFFKDDVISYLDQKEIYYSLDVEFKGKSNFSHTYDLLFQKNAYNPERLCNIIDNPNKSKIANTLFSWEDTKDARKVKNPDAKLVVIMNDQNNFSENILDALEQYDVDTILWSSIDNKLQALR